MIRSSEKIDVIAGVLNELQKLTLEVVKSEDNPFYKSKFAQFEDSWRLVRKPLTALGLSITQMPSMNSGFPCLTTRLMHVCGQWLEADYLLNPSKNDPQGMASAITYSRRNAFNAILGIIPIGEDDDGSSSILDKTSAHPNEGSLSYKTYVVNFGKKHNGKKFLDIPDQEKDSYAKYLTEDAKKQRKTLGGDGKIFVDMATAYFDDIDKQSEGGAWETDVP